MLSAVYTVERPPPVQLGHRRGISDLTPFAIVPSRPIQRAERTISAQSISYPSPPMSGSPHLPPKAPREASDRGLAPSLFIDSSSQDVRRSSLTQPRDPREQLPSPLPTSRPHPQEQPGMAAYTYRRPDQSLPRITTLAQSQPQPIPHGMHQGLGSQPYPHMAGPSMPSYLPQGQPPTVETQPLTSPTSQRKTKGHVASACVPCKKAHLRCDAQRPCSRCLSNGKEDSCVDVKHKKRGRPRLRDDRETRYDPSRFPHPPDVALRRPLSIYPSDASGGAGYADPIRRSQMHRVLKSQPSESMTPRFLERASLADANVYPAPLPLSTSRVPPEPVAYLTLDLEFSKASATFQDALGNVSMAGRKLADVVVPNEAERVSNIRNLLLGEQKRREPNYLPPILGRGDQIIQALGFSQEDVARFQVNHQDYMTFIADGHPRPYHIRFGLAEEGSFFFVVMILSLRYAPPNLSHGYDADRHRAEAGQPSQMGPGAMSSSFNPSYATAASSSSSRPPYAPSMVEQAPPPAPSSLGQHPQHMQHPSQPPFHLPPIRGQPPPAGHFIEQNPRRKERSSRVDIGGLIDKPEGHH